MFLPQARLVKAVGMASPGPVNGAVMASISGTVTLTLAPGLRSASPADATKS
jgi:hypothetical protein